MARRHEFDSDQARQLVAFLRAGGHPTMAAEGAGVGRATYQAWMHLGQGRQAREPFRSFFRQARQALAQGGLAAETAVFKKDPKFWLQHGPGKTSAELELDEKERFANSPEWLTIHKVLRRAMGPFPEAWKVVVALLKQEGLAPSR